ncbi:hypothetical protein HELRODRAFT_159116 [Helobdella robusta]|uniref:VWFA domain-containing protein n=1 Tax=Helobdella robusta TaxID=6412 RepID=T1ENM2_HELRO|nr:hypothetical protein HELRODRAFT_159116 [Helobdella robusta]ESO12558.1 hypothetical protein HELRODRAFT_159116 [Helobdella robusta]
MCNFSKSSLYFVAIILLPVSLPEIIFLEGTLNGSRPVTSNNIFFFYPISCNKSSSSQSQRNAKIVNDTIFAALARTEEHASLQSERMVWTMVNTCNFSVGRTAHLMINSHLRQFRNSRNNSVVLFGSPGNDSHCEMVNLLIGVLQKVLSGKSNVQTYLITWECSLPQDSTDQLTFSTPVSPSTTASATSTTSSPTKTTPTRRNPATNTNLISTKPQPKDVASAIYIILNSLELDDMTIISTKSSKMYIDASRELALLYSTLYRQADSPSSLLEIIFADFICPTNEKSDDDDYIYYDAQVPQSDEFILKKHQGTKDFVGHARNLWKVISADSKAELKLNPSI